MADDKDGVSAAPSDYRFTDQVGHLLRKAYQRHLAIFNENSGEPNLTSVQFVTLCALRDKGPSSQTDLVKATAVDQATIRGIIERLKTRGLIEVSKDKVDARKVIMSLRPAGDALLDEIIPKARLITELTVQKLNPAERVALNYLLSKLCEEMDV